MNLMNMCRACLVTKESFTYVLFENVSPDVYTYCTSIEVFENEQLPRTLCSSCYNQLQQYYHFKSTCLESYKTLLGLQGSLKLEKQDTLTEKDNNSLNDDIKKERVSEGEADTEEGLQEEYSNGYSSVDAEPLKQIKTETRQYRKGKVKLKDKHVKLKNSTKIQTKLKTQKQKEPYKISSEDNLSSRHYHLVCEICNKRFKHEDHFKAHKLGHEGKTSTITCTICDKAFKRWCDVHRHRSQRHALAALGSLQCPHCGKLLMHAASLKQHIRMQHTDKQPCICDVCGKHVCTQASLKRHMLVHSERRKTFPCHYCNKTFYNTNGLKKHVESHNGTAQRYICDFCSSSFTSKYSLEEHILAHQGIKRYQCDLCDKKFTKNMSKIIHRRTHTGERPFSCNICQKCFISNYKLGEHYRTHTGERRHKCKLCNQAYVQRGSLVRHMKVHNKQGFLNITGINESVQ